MDPSTGRLVVFGRSPDPGRVKTRLIPVLGATGAARVYTRLLARTLEAAVAVAGRRAEFWYPPDSEPGGADWARRFGLAGRIQQGHDLGQRMYHALTATADQPVVLIGSDCPGYTPAYLRMAFRRLATADAVLGPAEDGGYVLLGVHRPDPSLFVGIPWSTDRVAGMTRARLAALGWRFCELPTQRDIDRPADLASLPGL